MAYVDGFVLSVPRRQLAKYKGMARMAGRVWKEHGALEFRECMLDDAETKGMGVPFPRFAKAKAGEVVFFSYIVYRSRAHRDAVNKRVMSDPRMTGQSPDMPFDAKRMAYGGFKVVVQG
jgi:uncharacterized protein YbaA (DUF1428 family)